VNALVQLYHNGDPVQLAQFHYNNRDYIHGTNNIHFYVWHRTILLDIETRLRALPGYECVTVPYWNYQYSNSSQARKDRRSPFGQDPTKLGQGDTTGCIGGAFSFFTHQLDKPGPHCISRDPNDLQTSVSSSLFMDLADIGETTFLTFANNLQVAHGTPHVSFGDTFSSHYSPIDPLFWVHHANIDRAWDMWQDCHQDYNWYESGGLAQPIIGFTGVIAGDVIDNNKAKWKGQSYSVSYSSDDWEDVSLYSSDFRRTVATRCVNNGFRRYKSPNPVVGVDDAWARPGSNALEQRTLILPDGTQSTAQPLDFLNNVKEANAFLQCQSAGLDTSHGPILATYSDVTATECVSKCDKFFFKPSGDSNCMCTSLSTRPPSRVSLNASDTITRLAYFTGCNGTDQNQYGFYDAATASQASSRRLLQNRLQQLFQRRPNRLAATPPPTQPPIQPPTEPRAATTQTTTQTATQTTQAAVNSTSGGGNGGTQASTQAAASDVCFNLPSTNKQSAPATCSPGTPQPVLPPEWLQMFHISPDMAAPCQKYQKPVGLHGVNCVNV